MQSKPDENVPAALGGPSRAAAARSGRDPRDSLRDSLLVTHVDGMHCHRCEEAIVKAVSALGGVREVEVDFATGQASVLFDSRKVTAHQVIAAIEEAGYRCPEAGPP